MAGCGPVTSPPSTSGDTFGSLDRAKDVVKSGGEWISGLELENHLADHPDVVEAAVVGVSHATWQERPIAPLGSPFRG